MARRPGRGDWPDDAGRREDPDEFPGPASRSPSRQQVGRDERTSRRGGGVGYFGRYAGRAEEGFVNYGGRPGGVSGGHYGAYHDLDGSSRYGGQYAGLSPGDGRPSWRGTGPKGYVRSDERIREDVCECLTDDPLLDAGDIEVEVKEGEVTLSGSVSSRAARRHAEDLVDGISGVRHLQNNLRSHGHGHERHEPAPASRTAGSNGRPR
jgi:osmotically-inducible protein OsmY